MRGEGMGEGGEVVVRPTRSPRTSSKVNLVRRPGALLFVLKKYFPPNRPAARFVGTRGVAVVARARGVWLDPRDATWVAVRARGSQLAGIRRVVVWTRRERG